MERSRSPARIEEPTSLQNWGIRHPPSMGNPAVAGRAYETNSVAGGGRDPARGSRRGAGPLDQVRRHDAGVADFRRLLMAGRRAVREDRWEGVLRGESFRPQERGDRGHPARAAELQRQRRVLVRLLYPQADPLEERRPQGDVRATEPWQQDVG